MKDTFMIDNFTNTEVILSKEYTRIVGILELTKFLPNTLFLSKIFEI